LLAVAFDKFCRRLSLFLCRAFPIFLGAVDQMLDVLALVAAHQNLVQRIALVCSTDCQVRCSVEVLLCASFLLLFLFFGCLHCLKRLFEVKILAIWSIKIVRKFFIKTVIPNDGESCIEGSEGITFIEHALMYFIF
jgi:hypothetical protein